MKKILIIISMLFLTSFVGCGSNTDTIKIGFASTLTGQYAYVGNYELYGVQYAVEEINDAGGIDGKQLELIIKDDEANPEKAVEVDNELIDDGVNVIIGHGLSIVASSMIDNAEDKDVLFLSPSIGTDAISDIDDNFIRNVSTTYAEAKAMVESINSDNPDKILFIYNLDNFILTKYHMYSFEDTMETLGYTEADYEIHGFYSGDSSDYQEIETKLSSGEFDTVMIASSNLDAAAFLNYIDVNNIDIDVHLTSWATIGLLDNISTSNSETINAYFGYFDVITDPDFVSFKSSYEEHYSVELQMVAVNAYDLVYLLKTAIEHVGSMDVSELKNAIIEIGTFDGIAGDFTINEFGDCVREVYRMNIEDGEYVLREDE